MEEEVPCALIKGIKRRNPAWKSAPRDEWRKLKGRKRFIQKQVAAFRQWEEQYFLLTCIHPENHASLPVWKVSFSSD